MNVALAVPGSTSSKLDDGNVASPENMVTVGKLVKPFGVRGQARILSLTDVPNRFETLREVTLELPTGKTLVTTITDVRSDGRSYLLQFGAFSTPEEVKAYSGAWLKIPQRDVPPAPDGHHYQFELIGLTVQDESGNVFGTLEEVVTLPHQHLFVVRGANGEYLLPALRKWISSVDVPGGVMTVIPNVEWTGDDAM